jgi:hypothetical protein
MADKLRRMALGLTTERGRLAAVRYERADAPNRAISGLAGTDPCRRGLEEEPAEPRKRANFIFLAIFCSVGGSICACFLGILAFASALPGISHKYGATVLFVLAKSFYGRVSIIATLGLAGARNMAVEHTESSVLYG